MRETCYKRRQEKTVIYVILIHIQLLKRVMEYMEIMKAFASSGSWKVIRIMSNAASSPTRRTLQIRRVK